MVVEEVHEAPAPAPHHGHSYRPSPLPQAKTFGKRAHSTASPAQPTAAAQPAAKKPRASGLLARMSAKTSDKGHGNSTAAAPGKPFSDLLAGAGSTAAGRKPLLQIGRASSCAAAAKAPAQTPPQLPLSSMQVGATAGKLQTKPGAASAAPHRPMAAPQKMQAAACDDDDEEGGDSYVVDDDDLARQVAARMSRHRSRRARNRL